MTSVSKKQRYVYRDFSKVSPIPKIMEPSSSFPSARHEPATEERAAASSLNIRVQKLPQKLDAMLSDPNASHIITWLPHGRAWKILRHDEFESEVIPKYFQYTNYNSFIRLVNAWGFHRITVGQDRDSYYHELFLRGMPHLHHQMHRLRKDEKKPTLLPEDTPDFYKIEKISPLPLTKAAKLVLPPTIMDIHEFGNKNRASIAALHRVTAAHDSIAPKASVSLVQNPTHHLVNSMALDIGEATTSRQNMLLQQTQLQQVTALPRSLRPSLLPLSTTSFRAKQHLLETDLLRQQRIPVGLVKSRMPQSVLQLRGGLSSRIPVLSEPNSIPIRYPHNLGNVGPLLNQYVLLAYPTAQFHDPHVSNAI